MRIYPGLSDHFAVLGRVAVSRPAPVRRSVTSRNLRAIQKDEFSTNLVELKSDINESLPNLDIEGLVGAYNGGLRKVLDRHAPLNTRNVKDRPSAPWLTTEVRDARRDRRRAERRWRKTKLAVHKEMYINLRNDTKEHIVTAKRQFFANKIDNFSFSPLNSFSMCPISSFVNQSPLRIKLTFPQMN